MDLHESTVLSSEDRAKLEAELAEKERLRQIELQKIREQLNKGKSTVLSWFDLRYIMRYS